MKYMPTVGDNWEAWDTCFLAHYQRFSIGDVDGDMIADSLWVKPSSTTVPTINTDTIYTEISPLKYTVWISSLSNTYGIDSIDVWDYYRYVYVANFGKIEEHLDSERVQYYMGGIVILDTTFTNLYHKVIVSTGASETPRIISNIKGGEVYTVSGRLIRRFKGAWDKNSFISRKGTYFIVINTERGRVVRKVIVK